MIQGGRHTEHFLDDGEEEEDADPPVHLLRCRATAHAGARFEPTT
jgi:hypothetical protein